MSYFPNIPNHHLGPLPGYTPVDARAGNDATICPGDTIPLGEVMPGFPPAQFRWEPAAGLSDPTLPNPRAFPDTTTTYTLYVEQCAFQDSSTVTLTVEAVDLPGIDLTGKNRHICPGDSIRLGSDNLTNYPPGTRFDWQPTASLSDPHAPQPYAKPQATTTYTLQLTTPPPCPLDWTDEIQITVDSIPPLDLGPDRRICPGQTLTLDGGVAQDYRWSPDNHSGRYLEVTRAGTYALRASNGNCLARDTILIDENCDFQNDPAIPTAFTPNGDDLNPTLKLSFPQYQSVDFRVYNSWGQEVFSSQQQMMEWDGTTSDGQSVPAGVYIYRLNARNVKGIAIHKLGTITVIR